MEGVKVAATLNKRAINNPTARARNGGRRDLPQSLVIIKSSLPLIE
jgi:hypothetical protein